MIVEPVTLRPTTACADALELMETYHISGVPITDETGRLVGILTNRDLRFESDTQQPIANLMTSEDLSRFRSGRRSTRRGQSSPAQDREAAGRRRQRLPEGPDHGQGHPEAHPVPARDQGRAGAAPGRRRGRRRADALERAEALVEEDVDALVVDTSHGHSNAVVDTVRRAQGAASTSRSSPATSRPPRPRRRCSRRERTRSRPASGPGRSARRESSPGSASLR